MFYFTLNNYNIIVSRVEGCSLWLSVQTVKLLTPSFQRIRAVKISIQLRSIGIMVTAFPSQSPKSPILILKIYHNLILMAACSVSMLIVFCFVMVVTFAIGTHNTYKCLSFYCVHIMFISWFKQKSIFAVKIYQYSLMIRMFNNI